jgi:hypothetical protein
MIAYRLREDVLVWHDPSQFWSQGSSIDFLLDHGVVSGEPVQPVFSEQVDSAVSDMAQMGFVILDKKDCKGGAHTGVSRVCHCCLPYGDRGLIHCVPQPLTNLLLLIHSGSVQSGFIRIDLTQEYILHGFDGYGAGDFTRGVSPHAIRNYKETGFNVHEEAVFIALSNGSGVGSGDCIELHHSPSARQHRTIDEFDRLKEEEWAA